jgi:hypothetical protein
VNDMKKKKGKKTRDSMTKMQRLVEWNKRPFIDKMLDDGKSPNQVHKWIVDNGIDLSVPTVYAYAKKRKEAIMNDVKIEALLGHKQNKEKTEAKKKAKVTKDSTSMGDKTGSGQWGNMTEEERAQKMKTVNRVKSELEILDLIIDKGYKTLHMMEVLSPDMALKAIKLKNEITGGEHNSITMYGLEEIRLREAAKETAMTTILLEYIPEDKHDEVLDRMEKETKKYYESIGLGDAYEQMQEAEEEEEEIVNG